MSIADSNTNQGEHHSDESSKQELLHKCLALASNLWWSWNDDVISLFRDLDPQRWVELDHNPVALLHEFTPERLDQRAAEMVLYTRVNQAYRRLKEYITERQTWSSRHGGVLGSKPVAYFSAEFGVHESLPVYSGGLGVLSGDHIKSASGLGVPLVAVGLFYKQGYFRQRLDSEGLQNEEYEDTALDDLPIRPVLDENNQRVIVEVETSTGKLLAQAWLIFVGRVRLYLLDCNVEGNSDEDRALTSRLYGGDERTRIRQELILGIGGVRLLHSLGYSPGVYHLNEGHSAFAPLEVIRRRMEEEGVTFEDALRDTAHQTVFTTHTPVPAGHDRFDKELVKEHLSPMCEKLNLSFDKLMSLGRVEPTNQDESFCMTVIGLKLSRTANAVSQLHGHVSRRMWAHLWPWRVEEEIPIGHITNGVHTHTWVASQMQALFDRYFPPNWLDHVGEPETWGSVYQMDPGELWETHNSLKLMMINFVRRRLEQQCLRRNDDQSFVERARQAMNPSILTIGFARRFATYKRANLLFSDSDRLDALLNDPERPVQIVFSGKAHPKDDPGKEFIRVIAAMRHDPRFVDKVFFVEDYDVNVCRHLVQGVDVWLNNPRRPLEASGTSGQKVVLNGGLNCSILDGWWAEAFDGSNGFAIGRGLTHVEDKVSDQRDADALYDVLENELIPMYYTWDQDGLPMAWIQQMMNSIATLGWRFSSDRMVMDYTRSCYIPAAGGLSCKMENR